MLMLSSSPRWDVFIVHASADRAQAEALFGLLEREVRVFVTSRSLTPGDNWQTRIPDELRASRITLALVSPRMEQAYYANEEIAIVVDLARSDPLRHRVIPVLVGGAGWDTPRPYGLQSLHALLAGDAEGMARAARAVLALLDPARGTDATDAWAAPRSPRAEPMLPALPDGDGTYPPLQFITDDGRTEFAESAARLASLLEANPQHGETFLYQKYFEKRWAEHAPGVCAALTTIVDRRFPGDRLAGRMAAVYALDPARPYLAGTERVAGALAMAEHLRLHADDYRSALRNPRHPLWFHLRFWPDEAGREGMRPFQDAFTALRADEPAAAVALHRLILWLRTLGGDPRLPVGAALLALPTDALTLPMPERRAFAAALADETSLASAWIAETAPELGRLVATWRRTHPGEVDTLPSALGAGVCAGGPVRGPADAFDGPAEVIAALWSGDGSARERVDAYLATFHFAPLAEHALAWLRDRGRGRHAGAVILYAAASLDARAAGLDEARDVVPVLLAALERTPTEADTEEEILGRLARRTGEVLRSGSEDARPGARLVEWIAGAAAAMDAAAPGLARRWRQLLERTDDVLSDAYHRAWEDPAGLAPADDAALADALDALERHGVRLELIHRHARERDAFVRHAAGIAEATRRDASALKAEVHAAERADRAALLRAVEKMPEAAARRAGARRARAARRVLLVGLAGGGFVALGLLRQLYRAIRQYAAVLPEAAAKPAEVYGMLLSGDASAFPERAAAAWAVLGFTLSLGILLAALRPRVPWIVRWTVCVSLPAALVLKSATTAFAHPLAATLALPVVLAAVAAAAAWSARVARAHDRAANALAAATLEGAEVARLRAERLSRARQALAEREAAWRGRARRVVAQAGEPEAAPPAPPPPRQAVPPLPIPSFGEPPVPHPGRAAALRWALSGGVAAACAATLYAAVPRTEHALVVARCDRRANGDPATVLREWYPRAAPTSGFALFQVPAQLMGPWPRPQADSMLARIQAELREWGMEGACTASLEVQDAS